MSSSHLSASVDIGTNSVLLLVAETDGNTIRIQDEKQAVPRLGKGVDKSKNLDQESINRVLSVLNSYKTYLKKNYPEIQNQVTVTATSAVRDAANRADFMKLVKEETGWSVTLLSGDDEAQYTYRGAVAVLPPTGRTRCVLDIGGGSTEIAFGKGSGLISYFSLDIGSVRFTERYLMSDPPQIEELNQAANAVREALGHVSMPSIQDRPEAVGVAGTVTSIASINAGHTLYRPKELNNSRLDIETIRKFRDEFSSQTSKQTEHVYPEFMENRGDVIVGGLIILEEFLRWQHLDSITVSTGGIRHGALLFGGK